MSNRFSESNFDGPYKGTSSIKDVSGVYVILTDNDKVIDVGESHELKTRLNSHDRKNCWKREQGTKLETKVMYTDRANRTKLADRIRVKYNPPCGIR